MTFFLDVNSSSNLNYIEVLITVFCAHSTLHFLKVCIKIVKIGGTHSLIYKFTHIHFDQHMHILNYSHQVSSKGFQQPLIIIRSLRHQFGIWKVQNFLCNLPHWRHWLSWQPDIWVAITYWSFLRNVTCAYCLPTKWE